MTSAHWSHAISAVASGAVSPIATPATVTAIAATPTATKLANAKTLFEATTAIAITDIQDNQISLIWEDVPGITRYDVERNGAIISSNYALTTFIDTNLAPATTYTYRVRPKP